MLPQLKSHLDDLITLLLEIGDYQLKNQGCVPAKSKWSNKSVEEAWNSNEVFSEVDLWSEKRLIDFFNSQFSHYDFSFITEEYHSKIWQNSKYHVVIDPLDGTKPYLKGEKTFGISSQFQSVSVYLENNPDNETHFS